MSKVNGHEVLAWAILENTQGGSIRRSIELYEPKGLADNLEAVPCGALRALEAPPAPPALAPAPEVAAPATPPGQLPEAAAGVMARVYLAGFAASGEGWNGEVFADKGQSPVADPAFVKHMVADFQRLAPELADAVTGQAPEQAPQEPVSENPDDSSPATVQNTQQVADLEAKIADLEGRFATLRRAANMAKNTPTASVRADFILSTLTS